MKVTANRQLSGDYGTVRPGQTFTVDDETGLSLLRIGVVEPWYETKVIQAEVAPPGAPFRLVHHADEPPAVGGDSNSGVVAADVSVPRVDRSDGRPATDRRTITRRSHRQAGRLA